jgi:hypothetical protein
MLGLMGSLHCGKLFPNVRLSSLQLVAHFDQSLVSERREAAIKCVCSVNLMSTECSIHLFTVTAPDIPMSRTYLRVRLEMDGVVPLVGGVVLLIIRSTEII